MIVAAMIAVGCGDGGPSGSSFEQLQARVFDPQCVTCHTAGTAFAAQSGLVLDRGLAFANLVSVAPTQDGARDDGLLRVTPGAPNRSLIIHKLHWEPDFSARDYGSPMPLGGQSLTIGQIEFVRQWIAGGALPDGDYVDPVLLDDATLPDLRPFEGLVPPVNGFQLTTGRFGVAPDFERELFVYRSVGNDAPAYVNRVEIAMRPNSHHFVLYDFAAGAPTDVIPAVDVVRDLRALDGSLITRTLQSMAFHRFFGGSMAPYTDWQFPAGVALRLEPGAKLDLNSHYVNTSDAEIPGEVFANLHTVDSAAVQHVASALNMSNFGFQLPPKTTTTDTKTFLVSDTTYVFMLTSHMHKRGKRFRIRIVGGPRNGELVYETEHWDHPDIVSYDVPITLLPGQGLASEITWHNETDRMITFGLTSDDEMGIIFGYFY